jgi:GNAT superfamily N-acetyltransferase
VHVTTIRRAEPGDAPFLSTLPARKVAVAPEWQARGIAGALVQVVEGHARTTGTGLVRLYTNAAMIENRRLCEHLGYIEVARRAEYGFERVFYEKRLQRPRPSP